MNNIEKRDIILNHYNNPINRGITEDSSYIYGNSKLDSCIDEIHLMVKFNGNVIEDIKFDGEACAICISSTSLMIENVRNKSIDEIEKIYKELNNMLSNIKYDETILNDLVVYDTILKQPTRKKCVFLPWDILIKIITDYKQK